MLIVTAFRRSIAEHVASALVLTSHGALSCTLLAGLYAERVGAINFVLADAEAAKRVMSQLKRIARALYSNPPVHGEAVAPLSGTTCFQQAS